MFPVPCLPAWLARVVGVGSRSLRAIVIRLGDPALGRVPLQPFWFDPVYGDALGVGSKDEDSVSKMRAPDLLSATSTPRRIKPSLGKVSKYSSSTPRQQAWGVLNRDVSGSNLAKHAENIGPNPALIELAESIASEALRLAGKAGNDKIHAASEEATVEGEDVVPNWELMSAFELAGDENSGAVCLSLDGADDLHVVEAVLERELEPTDTGAEAEYADRRILIHGLFFHPGHASGRGVGFPDDRAQNVSAGGDVSVHGVHSHVTSNPACGRSRCGRSYSC